jgi:hypothetical protein
MATGCFSVSSFFDGIDKRFKDRQFNEMVRDSQFYRFF